MNCPQCGSPRIEGTFYECPNGHAWWTPNPGPQTRFLECGAHEVLYGGAAGGGKSAALVMAPLRWATHPHFKALILRRETTQLEELIDLTRQWYPRVIPGAHGVWKGGAFHWGFPAGAKLQLNHCKDPKDAFNYQGKQYQFVGFDELTHFIWDQYQEIKSRVRAAHQGLPRFLRSTSNPGGDGHEWVFKRWGAWLDPNFEAPGLTARYAEDGVTKLPPLKSGEVAWIEKRGDVEYFIPRPLILDPKVHTSRVFIGAKLSDNRVLMENDPGYARNLADLDPVRRAQLELGDWLVRPAKGLYFKRAWFKLVDEAPAVAKRVRYWDRAAGETPDADYTVGLKLARVGGEYFVEDIVRLQGPPGEVMATVKTTAELDGKQCPQVLELDPGQAGKSEAYSYAQLLAGHTFYFRRPTGDKITRAGPVSAQCHAGNIRVLKRAWTEAFIQEAEGFPEWEHDDQVDGLSGAFNTLLVLGGGTGAGASSGNRPQPPNPETMPLG
jgi:predicted phage terminase large subunit-like protein